MPATARPACPVPTITGPAVAGANRQTAPHFSDWHAPGKTGAGVPGHKRRFLRGERHPAQGSGGPVDGQIKKSVGHTHGE